MQELIDPKHIRTDLNTQIRVDWNEEAVKEYADAMEAGEVFPALIVYFDESGDLYILADGFHRLAAHMLVRPDEPILIEKRLGTVDDARWASICANQSHGIRRTRADKHNAVKEAFLHPVTVGKSNRQIASAIGVHHVTVGTIRKEMESTGEIHQSDFRIGQDGRTINTANIGTPPSTQEPEEEPLAAETPAQKCETCDRCRYFEDGICDADGSERLHWDVACEDFAIRVEEKPLPPLPPPDYDNAEAADVIRKKGESRPHKNRSLKNCITVHLPQDNPQLFAIELREHWNPEYLQQCIDALRHILEDDDT